MNLNLPLSQINTKIPSPIHQLALQQAFQAVTFPRVFKTTSVKSKCVPFRVGLCQICAAKYDINKRLNAVNQAKIFLKIGISLVVTPTNTTKKIMRSFDVPLWLATFFNQPTNNDTNPIRVEPGKHSMVVIHPKLTANIGTYFTMGIYLLVEHW